MPECILDRATSRPVFVIKQFSSLPRWISALAIASLLASATSAAEASIPDRPAIHPNGDSVAVVKVIEQFRAALAHADSAGVLALLAPDVLILESGDVETLADYRAHHIGADIAFARAVPGVHKTVAVRLAENTAWVTSTSVTQGQFEGRAVNSSGAELMVLTRTTQRSPWLVRAIHWSSHRRK